jgi:hypothetical protein
MMMDKEKLRQLDEDMQKDVALLEEAKAKIDNKLIAARLSQMFGKKYSSEFRGYLEISYDVAEDAFILKCDKEEHKFQESEIDLIPEQLKFFRKQALLKKAR